MFEQLFGSKTRVKLMKLFLENPEKRFFVRELTRLCDSLINSVRRELNNLVELKIILEEVPTVKTPVVKRTINSRKYYRLNPKNLFRQDLSNLFLKSKILMEKRFVEKIRHLGEIKYFCLSGTFIEDPKAQTDLLVVGEFEKDKVLKVLKEFEKEIERPINYTVMDVNEYQLRQDIADNFLEQIMANERNLVIVDKLTKKKKSNV
ncbi:MAG: putative transcriptional regulator [Parcubacteria group bacterium GW2011_GWC2_39_14]|nr:MAG: putative transcriptional regulator [Parcubacteria group bacterium GW2011_GWC2_39_14]KKR54468.1 MAG: putative transcriptional regulator [Parcubacteria group bacterium GW2011_GWA2_40_23]